MSITMSTDAHTQMMNEMNAMGAEIRELKGKVKKLANEREKAKTNYVVLALEKDKMEKDYYDAQGLLLVQTPNNDAFYAKLQELLAVKQVNADFQEELDVEHERYLSAVEKGSDQLCEVATELGIDHHGGTDDIITSIKKLKDRQSIMNATASVHIDDINQIHQDYGNMVRKLKEENKKLKEGRKKILEARAEAKDWTDGNIKWRDEEIKELKKKLSIKDKRSYEKQQKYIHYKNLVLEHELDDVSDYEDDDYMDNPGEKPFAKNPEDD